MSYVDINTKDDQIDGADDDGDGDSDDDEREDKEVVGLGVER